MYADAYDDTIQIAGFGLVLFIILGIALYAFIIFVYAKIIGRSGYPWPWVFIMFVPIVNVVMLLLFAFKEWPVQRELALTRQALEAATGSPFPPGSQLTHYGAYPIGSGLQAYGAGQGYAGQGHLGRSAVDPGQYDGFAQQPSGGPYGPKV